MSEDGEKIKLLSEKTEKTDPSKKSEDKQKGVHKVAKKDGGMGWESRKAA